MAFALVATATIYFAVNRGPVCPAPLVTALTLKRELAMKEFVKITAALGATGLGFATGYLIGGPILTQLILWLVGEDGSNRELYSQIRNGLPGMLAAFTAAVATAAAFGLAAERLINRFGIPGLLAPPAVDFRDGTVQLSLALM